MSASFLSIPQAASLHHEISLPKRAATELLEHCFERQLSIARRETPGAAFATPKARTIEAPGRHL